MKDTNNFQRWDYRISTNSFGNKTLEIIPPLHLQENQESTEKAAMPSKFCINKITDIFKNGKMEQLGYWSCQDHQNKESTF